MYKPTTPLKTLRTAQLFQISWPRISSGVGNRSGSIGGFGASLGLEDVDAGLDSGAGLVLMAGSDSNRIDCYSIG